jgi:hypothetical protein
LSSTCGNTRKPPPVLPAGILKGIYGLHTKSENDLAPERNQGCPAQPVHENVESPGRDHGPIFASVLPPLTHTRSESRVSSRVLFRWRPRTGPVGPESGSLTTSHCARPASEDPALCQFTPSLRLTRSLATGTVAATGPDHSTCKIFRVSLRLRVNAWQKFHVSNTFPQHQSLPLYSTHSALSLVKALPNSQYFTCGLLLGCSRMFESARTRPIISQNKLPCFRNAFFVASFLLLLVTDSQSFHTAAPSARLSKPSWTQMGRLWNIAS